MVTGVRARGAKESVLCADKNRDGSKRRSMTPAYIQTRVWLSIGIFVLGFLFTTTVSQVEQRRAERVLAAIADAGLPAVQHGRDAEGAFERVVKAYSDTFLIEDRSGLDRAASEGSRVLESLHRIGATRGISPERASSARRLAGTVTQFLAEANAAYGRSLPLRAPMTAESQGRIRRAEGQRSEEHTSELQS